MKYFPLVWAALRRKPVRALLNLLSVTTAFALLGLMLGFNASVQQLLATVRLDGLYVTPRFDAPLLQAQREQILRVPGVASAGYIGFLPAYYQDPHNQAGVVMIDDQIPHIRTDWPVTQAQYAKLLQSRDGVLVSRRMAAILHHKAGDQFALSTSGVTRADGGKSWTFRILEVFDAPVDNGGFMLGNYDYLDQARVAADRGKVEWFAVIVKDARQTDAIAHAIDRRFANSANPTHSITEESNGQSQVSSIVDIGFVTRAIAAVGLMLILFMTGNAIAQSVRERLSEFAAMKTLGFSDRLITALVFVESLLPCLGGTAAGLGLATGILPLAHKIAPQSQQLPAAVFPASVVATAFVLAAAVALAGAALPAWRLRRLDVAAILSGH